MDPATVALIVMALGLIVLAVEAFFPGGYLLIPGGVMVVIGVFGFVDSDDFYTWWTPAVAIISSIPITAATIYLYKWLGAPEPPTTTVAESLVGKTGVVTAAVYPNNLKGKVKIDHDVWSADSDEEIPEGVKVRVVSSEGVHVHVERSE